MEQSVLDIKDLRTCFYTRSKIIPAVNNISLSLKKGEVLGVVGESGSGKSVTALSILNLLPSSAKIEDGEVKLNGKDLIKLNNKEMNKIRGNEITMIFQEPMTSLNPVYTIGNQITEVIRRHKDISKTHALVQAKELLKKVEIPRPDEIIHEYPHQLSGGMRQRVMIAIAIACDPSLLIADEPTTALDVTIQAEILELMKKLNEEEGTAILFITHDLGVIAEICDRVVVMYGGKIVEEGYVSTILKSPNHPYTKGLINSIPTNVSATKKRLYSIPGSVPLPGDIKKGCHFAPRCPHVMNKCLNESPLYEEVGENHFSRCWLNS